VTNPVSEYEQDLVRMANQIAQQFALDAPARAAEMLADHLLRFWDPSMRTALIEGVSAGRMRVIAVVDEAVAILGVGP
jgi:hypothetical protein